MSLGPPDEPLPEKPRWGTYARYAFANPYNLSLLAGAAVGAALTGVWPLAIAAAAGEAVWMLFAPDSKFLQKVWFDKTWERESAEKRGQIRERKIATLKPDAQGRISELRLLRLRIQKMAQENPSFAGKLLRGELSKLEDLVDDFIDVSGVCMRYEDHLRTVDEAELEAQERRFRRQVEKQAADDPRAEVARKNLEVVQRRIARTQELRTSLQTARGQLDLIDNTFRLLADDIIGMRSPSELGERLDDLRSGVEAVRETARETERGYFASA